MSRRESSGSELAIESLVLKGDLSNLAPEEQVQYVHDLCRSLGLNPAASPFVLLRLNGKLVCYPRRECTDQLAALHVITREITEGPSTMTVDGTKLAFARCRATWKGRTETAIATLPLQDLANVLMKVESKAKRRATLSILGLGVMNEMQEQGADEQAEAQPYPSSGAPPPDTTPLPPPSPPKAALPAPPTEAKAAEPSEGEDLAWWAGEVKKLTDINAAPILWGEHRKRLGELPKERGKRAWEILVHRVAEVGKLTNAGVWLKKAIGAGKKQ